MRNWQVIVMVPQELRITAPSDKDAEAHAIAFASRYSVVKPISDEYEVATPRLLLILEEKDNATDTEQSTDEIEFDPDDWPDFPDDEWPGPEAA